MARALQQELAEAGIPLQDAEQLVEALDQPVAELLESVVPLAISVRVRDQNQLLLHGGAEREPR